MPTASPSDLTTWRTHPQTARGYLFILKPRVVFTARVNQDDVYPAISLTYDGGSGDYTDIEPGMTLWLGSSPGGYNLGRQRVRGPASSTQIPIGRTGRGKGAGELAIRNDMYITVVDLRELWSKIPYITPAGVSYKDQIAFSSSIAQPPVANGGPAVADFVDPLTGKLSVTFPNHSFAVDPTAGGLTYRWDFDDGSTSTSATPTHAFDPGFYYVRLTVDDGTRTHTTAIPVFAAQRTGIHAPIPVEVSTRTLRPEGQTASFTLRVADLPITDYPPGTLCIYFEEERYGMTAPQSLNGTSKVKFVGWLDTEPTEIEAARNGLRQQVTLQCLDAAGRLAKLPGFGQIIQNKATPTTWQEMNSANIDRYLHHLLHWHSTALEVAPFTWSGLGELFPFKELGSDGGNLYMQVDQRARAIACRLVCTSQGELKVNPEPQRQRLVDRTSTEIVELTPDDWTFLGYNLERERLHWLRASAVLASSTQVSAFESIAPGATPGQGEGDSEVGEQLVRSQAELNERTGHDYARGNAQYTNFRVRLTHGGDLGIEPAHMEWVNLPITADEAAQRGIQFSSGQRFLPIQTTITYDHTQLAKSTEVELELEANGYPGETVVKKPTTPPAYPTTPQLPTYPDYPEDPGTTQPPDSAPSVPIGSAPMDGSMVLAVSPSWAGITKQFRIPSHAPRWTDFTHWSGDEVGKCGAFSGFGTDVYLLSGDGETAHVHYGEGNDETPNLTTSPDLAGNFTQLRTTDEQGVIYVYGIGTENVPVEGGPDAWSYSIDFTQSPGGWSSNPNYFQDGSPTGAEWVAGVGWRSTATAFRWWGAIQITIPHRLITGICFSVDSYTFGIANFKSIRPNASTYVTTSDYCTAAGLTYESDYISVAVGSDWGGNLVITGITITGTGGDPFATVAAERQVTRESDDFAVTFAPNVIISSGALSPFGGLDALKVGNYLFAGGYGYYGYSYTYYQPFEGVSYTVDVPALPAGLQPSAIWVPYYKLGSTTLKNTNTADPDYLVASAVPDASGKTVYKVVAGVYTDISPSIGGVKGKAVSPNCIAMPWRSGQVIAGIFDFSGTRHLVVSSDSGATWADRGALSADACSVRFRKGDKFLKELYIADGNPVFSPDFGVTLIDIDYPASDALVSLEPYG